VTAVERVKERLRVARGRLPWLDHAVRAYDRNSEVQGGQLSAAVTYFGFLSFFPLLALAFALVGYISVVFPDAQDAVMRAVEDAFPSLIGSGEGQIDIQDVIDAKAGATLFGILGLAYAGLGWLDALRVSLRRVFGTDDVELGLVRKKLVDAVVMVLLGLALLLSLVVSSLATAATTYALDLAGLDTSVAATTSLKVLSVVLALMVNVVIFAILLSRLSGARLSWRQVRSGALLGAVGFEVLKLFGTFLIGRTTANPLYATFGVVVGLLVWINLVSKLTIFAGAWTATQAYSLVPAPLGDVGAGRSTGLAAGSEPVLAVAPGDYEAAPVEADAGGPSRSRSSGRVRGVLLGAGIGAALAATVSRRRSRR
jgi:membrane protein